MKKLLIIALMLTIAGCAKQKQEIEPTGFTEPKTRVVVKQEKNVSPKVVSEKQVEQVIDFINGDSEYQAAVKESLQEKIETNRAISELFSQIKNEKQEEVKVSSLKPEVPVMEEPENLKPLILEPTLTEKLYNVTIKPVRKQLLKWNMYINKEVPKYMREVKNNPSLIVMAFTLFASFIYGIIHTLGPGHGKMVVATYFLTQKANVWQGIWLGLQTAFAHVGGAVVLVLVTDIALRSLVLDPAKHMYLLKNISFGLIIFVGLFMLVQAVLHATGLSKRKGCVHCDGHQHHGHSHGHHAHDHHHESKKPTKRELLIALSIGCIPCTGSLLILLYAMAHGILAYGLLMVLFVALGMALTMIIIGLVAIFGKKKLLDKYLTEGKHAHKYSLGLEFAGAVFIIIIGSLLLSINL